MSKRVRKRILRRQDPALASGDAYAGALVATACVLPLVAAMTAIAGYRFHWDVFGVWSSEHSASGSPLVLFAIGIGIGSWLYAARWYRGLTQPRNANVTSYGQLCLHIYALDCALELPEDPADTPLKSLARLEAAKYRALLHEEVRSEGDLRWVLATGYVNAWALMHRAEETLYLLTPIANVVNSGYYDVSRLQDSRLEQREDFLRQARQALHTLGAASYLLPTGETSVGNGSNSFVAAVIRKVRPRNRGMGAIVAATGQARQTLHTLGAVAVLLSAVKAMPGIGSGSVAIATRTRYVGLPTTNEEEQARLILAGVRRAINEYRDSKYAGLVQARNRAFRTMLVTAYASFILLGLIIIADVPERTLLHATAIFLDGALVGLFSRLFDESQADGTATIEDYGLSTMRLLTRPLLSGLAAIAGVLIVLTLPNALRGAFPASSMGVITESSTRSSLASLFDIEQYPFALVIAATFGLTPRLLFNRLQKTTEDLKADLRASTPTSQGG